MSWIVDFDRQTIEKVDSDTGVTLRIVAWDNEAHTWAWQAIDPDGEEFTQTLTPTYGPREHQTLWGTIEAAEDWYAEWLHEDNDN